MKKLILKTFVIALFGLSILGKGFCDKHTFPKNKENYIEFSTSIPKAKNQETLFSFTTKKKKYSTQFYCMKSKDHYKCVGDDDSGKYEIYKDHIILYALTLGHPDKDLIEVRFKKPQKLKFKKENCN